MTFENAKLVWELRWDVDWVTAVQFIGNSRRVVAGNRRGNMMEWELPEKLEGDAPDPVRFYEGHSNSVTKLRCIQDGSTLYSSSFDHSIREWDMNAKDQGETKVVLNEGYIYQSQFKRYSKKQEPMECDVALRKDSKKLGGHREWVNVMELSKDEKILVSGDDGGHVVFRDRASGKIQKSWNVEGWVHAVAISPDSKQALISERRPLVFDSAQRRALKLWNVDESKATKDLSEEFKKMYLPALAWSPDGKTLLVGRGEEEEGKIWMLDAETGEKKKELEDKHQYGVTDFLFHPNGKHFFSAGRDTVIRIWSLEDGTLVKKLGEPRGGQFKDWIHAIDITPDGKLLAAADMAGQVNIWQL